MIDIIPKEKPAAPLWANALFAASLILLVGTLGAGLAFSLLESKKMKELSALEQDLQNLTTSEEKAMEAEVLRAKQKLDDFSGLVAERKQILGGLGVLEEIVHPAVTFTGTSLDTSTQTVQASGVSAGFLVLEQQMRIVRSHATIQQAELSTMNLQEDGTVAFELSLTLTPNVFSSHELR